MKAVLVVWIGLFQSQSISVTVFPSVAECDLAMRVIAAEWGSLRGDMKCLPYMPPEVAE